VKEFLQQLAATDLDGLLRVIARISEWIFPGTDWPLDGTWRARGRAIAQGAYRKD